MPSQLTQPSPTLLPPPTLGELGRDGDFGRETSRQDTPGHPQRQPRGGFSESFLTRLEACAECHPERRSEFLRTCGPAEREFAEFFLDLHPSRRATFLRRLSGRPGTSVPGSGEEFSFGGC
jgi:hypothetical protein